MTNIINIVNNALTVKNSSNMRIIDALEKNIYTCKF